MTLSTFGQGFYDIEKNFELINKGKKKVNVFMGAELVYSKTIDSINRIVIKNTVQPTKIHANSYAPKFDDDHSISYREIFFYNSKGTIDSTILINYTSPLVTIDGGKIPAGVDSTLIVYGKTLLMDKILTRNYYSIKKGARKLYRTDHYGYDSNDRLIILIEDDGHTQFYFEYDNDENISAYYVHGVKVSFQYDELGRKSKDIYVTSTITYEYDDNSLLIKKISSGKNEGVFTYKYE